MILVVQKRIIHLLVVLVVMLLISVQSRSQSVTDTTKLPYQVKPQSTRPYDPKTPSSNINLKNPANITTEVEYKQESNEYIIHQKAGTVDYASPYSMSFDEYKKYDIQKSLKDYWQQRFQSETFERQNSLIPKLNVGSEVFETIFGSNTIDIKPQGSASLKFGLKITNTDNKQIPEELRRQTTFDFKEEIQMNVTGKIGENLEMKVSYNTESQFSFDNKMNLRYQGKEDDILQKIEAGNVSLPLSTSLITGSQSLFGLLTEMKFGKLYVSTVFSQQEGETKTITTEGGAQKSDYDISVVDYDKNRHFFLSHYFRSVYDNALKQLPIIYSSVNITKIEVYVTNTKGTTENGRNMIAFMDLGEERSEYPMYNRTDKAVIDDNIEFYGGVPDNDANNLYATVKSIPSIRNINQITRDLEAAGFEGSKNYEKVEYARKLSTSEYTLNPILGYISLNDALNADEVLAVAFEYTVNGQSYKVGEFSTDGYVNPDNLILKLLRGTNFTPKYPNWKLMMKNIYSLGGYQVNKDGFVLEVEYYNDKTRVLKLNNPLLSKDIQDTKILNLLNLDNLNSSGNYINGGDGVFDFAEGVTIKASNGRIFFPQVEPFGGYLADTLGNPLAAQKYIFQELYDSTQYKAMQITSKKKFYLKGSYKSAGGSDIMLNSFNIPEGSVKVTAGGITLVENQDYTVDYNMGRVKIINESLLVSGTPIKVSLESNSMFSIQSKRLFGTHLEYRFNDDFNLGGTIMNLTEKPMTKKVSIGEEPISNTIWGLNGSYKTDAPFLTKAVDFLPLIETKEKSSITFEGEFAQLLPGHNSAIGAKGNAFIDDFEGSESSYDMTSREGWVLASIPQQQENIFRYAGLYDDLRSGYYRAKLAWYKIDPLFFRSGSPVSAELQSSLKVYRVEEQDIFPNRDQKNGIPSEISTFDLTYDPNQRGPYNYTTNLKPDGSLQNPADNWAGIMRQLTTNDFEASNIEYVEFWMMDPFVEEDTVNPGGELIFNFGNISEDILKDSRKSYEHGLPTDFPSLEYDSTAWGYVPATQHTATSFLNEEGKRKLQDIGLDGLASTSSVANQIDEKVFFASYLNALNGKLSPEAYAKVLSDPSADDYHYFRGSDYDENGYGIIQRYMDYNGFEGNSPVTSGSSSTYGTSQPDVEDINGDFTLSENESYFQYRVKLDKNEMEVGKNFITDIRDITVNLKKGNAPVKWYQFRIPLSSSQRQQIGDIQDFKSVRFMRMLLHGWDSSVTLRFATLQLVRSEWRKYDYVIKEGEESLLPDNENADPTASGFSVSTVNIEESGSRYPVNYLLPPGVDRQQDPSQQQLTQLNEQSMAIRVDSLVDGYSKAIYKTIDMDMRDYKHLQMYLHAEARGDEDELENDDLTCFVRIGSDYTDNYYEYELPLKVTPWRTPGSKPYPDNDENRKLTWPTENNMDIVFEDLLAIKQSRNNAIRAGVNNVSLTIPYSDTASDHQITVKGNPNLATIRTIMIGIRNPLKKGNRYNSIDAGDSKSAEIWVNELRLTDFDEKGGWAAMGRMTMRLADFGSVSVAGSTTQAGFGSIEQTGQERAKEQTNQVDVAVNLEMGKIFPKEANVRIPMFVGYSRTAINPEYNPLDQDIPLKTALKALDSPEEKKAFKKEVQDLTERKSINFTNVGIGSTGKGKPKFYSPSNISITYAYAQLDHRDISTSYNTTITHNGSINYVFNNQPKAVEPFKNVKLLKKPYLRLIGDFNFYYAPSQIAYRTGMNRRYNETLLRNLNNPEQLYTPTCDKYFDWERQFDFKYSLTKGLKIEWSANTTALIEEPEGLINKDNKSDYEKYRDEVWRSILDFGVAQDHNQKFSASYTIPINKIPLFDWVSATTRYSSTYDWQRGPDVKDPDLEVGNTIGNSGQISGNLQFNMDNLYNKVGFIEDINKKYKKSRKERKKPKMEDVEYSKENVILKADQAKTISHKLNTEEEISVTVLSQAGKPIESTFEIINENRIEVKVKVDAENAKVTVKGKREVVDSPIRLFLEGTVLAITGFKQTSVAYTVNNTTTMGGYNKDFDFMELADNPGLGFVFGIQDTAFARKMGAKGNLINNTELPSHYTMSSTVRHDFKATYQPIKDLRIDFTGQRSVTENRSELYKGDSDAQDRKILGAYTINVWSISTAFGDRQTKKHIQSVNFDRFNKNIHKIAWQLAEERRGKAPAEYGEYDPEYIADSMPLGYTPSNPDVSIPAFLAAYTGSTTNKSAYNFMNWMFFRPGWRLKYDGLMQYDFFATYFKNLTLSHGYNSTFTVGSFESNLRYRVDEGSQMSWVTSEVNPEIFVPKNDIASFSLTEQFLPLFGIEMTWKNSLITKFEYKKSRTMTMSMTNNQMLELYTQEYVIGGGYRIEKLELPIQMRNQDQKPVSDLNLRADLTIRDNMSVTRDFIANKQPEITAGQLSTSLNLSAEYQLSEKLTIRFYFDRTLTDPKMTKTYRNSDTQFGFQFRFSLAEI